MTCAALTRVIMKIIDKTETINLEIEYLKLNGVFFYTSPWKKLTRREPNACNMHATCLIIYP